MIECASGGGCSAFAGSWVVATKAVFLFSGMQFYQLDRLC